MVKHSLPRPSPPSCAHSLAAYPALPAAQVLLERLQQHHEARKAGGVAGKSSIDKWARVVVARELN